MTEQGYLLMAQCQRVVLSGPKAHLCSNNGFREEPLRSNLMVAPRVQAAAPRTRVLLTA